MAKSSKKSRRLKSKRRVVKSPWDERIAGVLLKWETATAKANAGENTNGSELLWLFDRCGLIDMLVEEIEHGGI